jgi:hypothetical protein
MWGGPAAGEGSGVGLIVVWVGGGVWFAGAWAVDLGEQAARRQADMTRATNRIPLQPTGRRSRGWVQRFLGKSLEGEWGHAWETRGRWKKDWEEGGVVGFGWS